MQYIQPLDSIRAIAVILVLIWHWLPKDSLLNHFRTGPLGVTVFFVLSGYLITKILLENRNKAEAFQKSRSTVLKGFYVRRILRIFPAYYLTILLVWMFHKKLGLEYSSGELVSGLTYTSNFYVHAMHSWPPLTPHFWSLAVEEQFYLVWPLMMLFCHKKYLLPAIVCFIATGIGSQFWVEDIEFGYVLPQTCLDALGSGALLAWMGVYQPSLLKPAYRILSVLALVGLFLILLDLGGIKAFYQWRILYSALGAWIICYILTSGEKNRLNFILNNRLLVQIGKLSYGVYLYHILYFYLGWKAWMKYVDPYVHISNAYWPYVFFGVNIWILFFLCWLSRKLIEEPVLRLKSNFKYLDGKAGKKAEKAVVSYKPKVK